ncbi:hypothetical protein [Bacteroides stercoris]|uniref:hypothetical protein n=1 Tax=Bacteroides stercoris TaxID=46506 RepID=UPI0015F2F5EE|nr:hypothetical protein [Bacteroides stercoris]
MLVSGFEHLFNFKFSDQYKKRDEVIKRKVNKRTGFLDRMGTAINEKAKEESYW